MRFFPHPEPVILRKRRTLSLAGVWDFSDNSAVGNLEWNSFDPSENFPLRKKDTASSKCREESGRLLRRITSCIIPVIDSLHRCFFPWKSVVQNRFDPCVQRFECGLLQRVDYNFFPDSLFEVFAKDIPSQFVLHRFLYHRHPSHSFVL